MLRTDSYVVETCISMCTSAIKPLLFFPFLNSFSSFIFKTPNLLMGKPTKALSNSFFLTWISPSLFIVLHWHIQWILSPVPRIFYTTRSRKVLGGSIVFPFSTRPSIASALPSRVAPSARSFFVRFDTVPWKYTMKYGAGEPMASFSSIFLFTHASRPLPSLAFLHPTLSGPFSSTIFMSLLSLPSPLVLLLHVCAMLHIMPARPKPRALFIVSPFTVLIFILFLILNTSL